MATQTRPTPCAPKRILRSAYAQHELGDYYGRRLSVFAGGPSPVRQDMRDECDINNIVLRYSKTGDLPVRLNRREPEFLDVSDVGDLQVALNRVNDAKDIIEALRREALERETASEEALEPSESSLPPSGSGQDPRSQSEGVLA